LAGHTCDWPNSGEKLLASQRPAGGPFGGFSDFRLGLGCFWLKDGKQGKRIGISGGRGGRLVEEVSHIRVDANPFRAEIWVGSRDRLRRRFGDQECRRNSENESCRIRYQSNHVCLDRVVVPKGYELRLRCLVK